MLLLEIGVEFNFFSLCEIGFLTVIIETTGQIAGMGNGMAFPSIFPFAGGTQVGFFSLHIFAIGLSCLEFSLRLLIINRYKLQAT